MLNFKHKKIIKLKRLFVIQSCESVERYQDAENITYAVK